MVNKTNLLLALLFGLIATLLMHSYVKNIEEDLLDESETVKVITVVSPIKTGEIITRQMVEEKEMPKRFVVDGNISRVEEVLNKYALVDMSPGEQIIRARLTDDKVSKDNNYHLPKGLRAMMFSLSDEDRLGGILKSGDSVDVIAVLPLRTGEGEVSMTVLQDVTVLSAGEPFDDSSLSENLTYSNMNFMGYGSASSNIVLAVTPEEAQQLALLDQYGRIKLSLRPFGDVELEALNETKLTSITISGTQRYERSIQVIKGIELQETNVDIRTMPSSIFDFGDWDELYYAE